MFLEIIKDSHGCFRNRMCVLSIKKEGGMELHLLRQKKVSSADCSGWKIRDRLIWIQNVIQCVWEVDTEKRILCMVGTV